MKITKCNSFLKLSRLDINFSKKISEKRFNDASIVKKDKKDFDNIENITNELCKSNRDFELEPHPNFVRNF